MSMNVLVVDDDPDLRGLVATVLQDEGHSVSQAANGRDALELVQSQPFDAILTDGCMPLLDGAELAARCQQLPGRADTRVILITGADYGNAPAGVESLLRKPFTLDQLLDAVRPATISEAAGV
ncbi:MAG: response regulator [Chloroflexi bacterium]|nr:response regulator [Chloroflexota bacterium]